MATYTIYVNITQDGEDYIWTYDGSGVHKNTGNLHIPNQDPATIIYQLDDSSREKFNLVYANLSPTRCITAQISAITYDDSKITIHDLNIPGNTGTTPFGFILVARPKNNIIHAILSPDPEVDNNPPIRPPMC